MPSLVFSLLAATAVALGLFYQVYLAPLVDIGGMIRKIEPVNNERCEAAEGLQACEKLIIHSSGLVYLACASSPYSRTVWMPTMDALNATAMRAITFKDYVATYDPRSRKVTKLEVFGFAESRGLNLHGMDVVPDEHDPELLWVYLVNHRPPLDLTVNAAEVGADSVIEIFTTRLGSKSIEWVKTVEDPETIVTPNDIIGGSNGQEFWFTNDHHIKFGMARKLHVYFGIKSTSVGYCHVNTGCKIAADELYASNGIVRDNEGKVWVGSVVGGYITIHEQQADKTLVPIDVVKIGQAIDNLALSSDGSIVAATLPWALHFAEKASKNPNLPSPASAFRISTNTGHSAYFGEKYKVEKVYESDGSTLGSAATTASIHQDHLYLHGLMAHRMLICEIPTMSK